MPVIDLGEQPHDANGATAPASTTTPDGATSGNPTDPGAGPPVAPDGVVPQPVAVPDSPLAKLTWVLGAAESLALSGAAVVVAAAIATWPMLFMFLGQEIGPDLTDFMIAVGVCGLLGGGLGIAAILRLRPETHPLVRGCAGCAVVLGLLLIVIAAIGTIQASGEHTVPEPML
jgi:hypothetical protein